MRPFHGKRVLLGVTGGIACYKSVLVARELTQAGAKVDVVLTRAAAEFVGAVTFEAVTGRAVHTALIAAGHALDHIRLARAADVVAVAPATADFLARAAHGRADDLLSACLLATEAPVLLAPAMNDRMWAHAQTMLNVAHLREIGYFVLDPDVGPLAVGEGSGPGRMPEPPQLVAHIGRLLEPVGAFSGRRVVVTAGPTREPLDPVRFLSNHSSGRMGVALAAAAWRRGAQVTLVHGPLAVPLPTAVHAVAVETTEEMCAAVAGALAQADVLVMAAAPADFAPDAAAPEKLKKASAPDAIQLRRTPDILKSTRHQRRPGAVVVGFALETERAVEQGRGKLTDKGLDMVVVNDAREAGAGFGVDTNRVTLVHPDGADEVLPLASKAEVADAILDRVERLLEQRGADGR
ncbi:MAG TPA: bifunctional phosphopantothenoylcysteine decarboxylase/phosphopantothenate--cysteine ligase CoaBC [Gemmatimonadaceae bacterium]|nr:bifunctional phosphopantothenoylcysteine decarboxylase/phosphopantothenate--cysteine ligase CoaBC [Gemmatimonadaceae bacterium]